EIGAGNHPMLTVYNKIDLVPDRRSLPSLEASPYRDPASRTLPVEENEGCDGRRFARSRREDQPGSESCPGMNAFFIALLLLQSALPLPPRTALENPA